MTVETLYRVLPNKTHVVIVDANYEIFVPMFSGYMDYIPLYLMEKTIAEIQATDYNAITITLAEND